MSRAGWLESDAEYEGVGAHPLNPRYDPVDEDDPTPAPKAVPQPLLRAQTFVAAPTERLDGHDGSHHQYDAGPVDLEVLASATRILWWKATQSVSYKDPTFDRVWGRRRLWSHRGAYHWLSSTTDPEQQAAWFLRVTGELAPGDFMMGDFEEAGITVPWCLGFMEYVEARRKRPVSPYSGLYVAGGTIWRDERIREGKYGPRPMHLAAYIPRLQLLARMKSLGLGADRWWDAWQYWSGGPVPGITGRADMNTDVSWTAYDRAAGLLAPPTPVPTPGGDMTPNYYVCPDATAKFIGTPSMVWWTGPGDARIEASINLQLSLGNLIRVDLAGVGAFADSLLMNDLPTGDALHVWTGDEFTNAAQIHARLPGGSVDSVARLAIADLSAQLSIVRDGLKQASR